MEKLILSVPQKYQLKFSRWHLDHLGDKVIETSVLEGVHNLEMTTHLYFLLLLTFPFLHHVNNTSGSVRVCTLKSCKSKQEISHPAFLQKQDRGHLGSLNTEVCHTLIHIHPIEKCSTTIWLTPPNIQSSEKDTNIPHLILSKASS